jgi:glycosyltransferase involved in cell wall biosynthesis
MTGRASVSVTCDAPARAAQRLALTTLPCLPEADTASPGSSSRETMAQQLHVSLDTPLPKEVAIGAGTALFVAGTCFCPDGRIDTLELVVNGTPQPLLASGMPRLDFFRTLHPRLDPLAMDGLERDPESPDDPLLHSYRSGFWGIARIRPDADRREIEIMLRARLERGQRTEAKVASIKVVEVADTPVAADWPEGPDRDSVAICMATYNPPLELFRRQIESIRAQSHCNWVCVISDDRSTEEAFAQLRREVEGDRRFVVSRSSRRLGFFRNFERALAMAPVDTRFVAMADQDDCWHPDKLSTLIEALGSAQLVYSDARVVARSGDVISDTYWSRRRNNHTDLLSLLVANAVTGAASLMRRELLDYALPFPPAQFAHFHDHWVGLTALALGEIAFVDRPLYDYVQHGEASLGHAAANRMVGLRDRLLAQRDLRERIRMWRLHYFVDVCRLLLLATILQLRCGDRMSASKRRTLDRFMGTEDSLGSLLHLAGRGARELVGRPETLGAEWMLFHAFAWRRLLTASVRPRPQRRLRLDAVPPPALALKPARVAVGGVAQDIADKIAPLDLAVSDTAPVRVNLLIPTIDLEHFFGGYIAKLNLAKRLAERGLRVRVVTVDPVPPLPHSWRRQIEAYSGLEGMFESVEVEFGRGPSPLELSPEDGFIATTWWTAHIAAGALRTLGRERFVYLIQEYEPFTFPMGAYAALARQSYDFEHSALFSTELLRGYFRRHRIGVYASGREDGDRRSLAFENAITAVPPPTEEELAGRAPRRLLFYARPEPHAARNLFELGALALGRALEEGYFQRGWELHGIGTVTGARTISLGAGATLELLPRSAQRAYADVLRRHDVGLALMYTPHPSLVPIEMASAGMIVVTNSFENKTREALAAISPNIIAGEPSIDGIAAALKEASVDAGDLGRRVAGSNVSWSRDWAQTFDERVLSSVATALERGDHLASGSRRLAPTTAASNAAWSSRDAVA